MSEDKEQEKKMANILTQGFMVSEERIKVWKKLFDAVERVITAFGQPCQNYEHPDDFIDELAGPMAEMESIYNYALVIAEQEARGDSGIRVEKLRETEQEVPESGSGVEEANGE